MLGLELDVSAFAAGPTARLSTTVAVVLTIVLVLGAPNIPQRYSRDSFESESIHVG